MEKFINIVNKNSNIDEIINNLEIFEKGWKLNNSNLKEPWFYDSYFCNAENVSKAKALIWKLYKYELSDAICMSFKEEKNLNYLNLSVIRCKEIDKFNVIIDGKETQINRNKLYSELNKLKRKDFLNDILINDKIQFVFINKNGGDNYIDNYYGDNYKGYYTKKDFELIGIYNKEEAIKEALRVSEINIEPINIDEYNEIINKKIDYYNKKIDYLKTKIFENGNNKN